MDTKENRQCKYKSNELVIVRKEEFPVLVSNPIDSISTEDYSRIEKLTSLFVLRAPLSDITKLSNPSRINMFKSSAVPEGGSRTDDRRKFESVFLTGKQIDCTNFEFIYRRRSMKPSLEDLDLIDNSDAVFKNSAERAVVFVGKNGSGKEDSCIESICRHVRNGIAHGRIALKHIDSDPYLFVEDGLTPSKVEYEGLKPKGPLLEVRFRMLVKLSTLEDWYGILLADGTHEAN